MYVYIIKYNKKANKQNKQDMIQVKGFEINCITVTNQMQLEFVW